MLRLIRDSATGPLAGGTVARRADVGGGWVNPSSGQGGVLDRHAHTRWAPPVRLPHTTIDSLVEFNALARRIVSREPEDATRKGFEWANLPDGMDVAALDAECERLGLLGVASDAWTWALAYGGAGVLVVADDGAAPDQPISAAGLRQIRKLVPLDRYDLAVRDVDMSPTSSRFGEPLSYSLGSSGSPMAVHWTRVVRFDGVRLPRRVEQQNQGWGGSVLDLAWAEIRNWSQANEYAAEALVTLSQGVFKQKGLADAIDAGRIDEVVARWEAIATGMGALGNVTLDAELEDFQLHQRTLSGMKDALDALTRAIVAATGIPRAILMGEVPGGLNAGQATGEFRVWYDHVASRQQNYLAPRLRQLITLVMRQSEGPTKGEIAAGFGLRWADLSEPSSAERATMRVQRAQARQIDITSGVVTPDEARQDPDLVEVYDIDPLEAAPGPAAAPSPFAAIGGAQDVEDEEAEGLGEAPVSSIPEGESLVSLREAGERLGFSPGQLRGLVRRGGVRSWRLRPGGPIMIAYSELLEHIEAVSGGVEG